MSGRSWWHCQDPTTLRVVWVYDPLPTGCAVLGKSAREFIGRCIPQVWNHTPYWGLLITILAEDHPNPFPLLLNVPQIRKTRGHLQFWTICGWPIWLLIDPSKKQIKNQATICGLFLPNNKNWSTPRCLLLESPDFCTILIALYKEVKLILKSKEIVFYIRVFYLLLGSASKSILLQYFNCAI